MPGTEPKGRPHRNHGLFSDHYPNATLPGRPGWAALAGEAEGVMAEVSRVIDAYAPSQNEAQTEEDLVRPVLRLLGHEGTYEVQPALDTPEGTKRPDYVFYRDAASRDANKDRRLTDDLLAGVSFAVGDAMAAGGVRRREAGSEARSLRRPGRRHLRRGSPQAPSEE